MTQITSLFGLTAEGQPALLTIDQLRTLLANPEPVKDKPEIKPDPAPVTDPPVVDPPKPVRQVLGYPRVLVGHRGDNPVYLLNSFPYLWEATGTDPDQGLPRGFNMPYNSLPGVDRPAGPASNWGGMEAPASFDESLVLKAGYEKRHFNDPEKTVYYAQVGEAGEPFPGSGDVTILNHYEHVEDESN